MLKQVGTRQCPGSAVAWTDEFDAEGRTWVITPDFTFLPKDRIKKHARTNGAIAPTGDTWPRLAWVQLAGAPVEGAQPDGARMPVSLKPPEGGRKTWVEISVLSGWMIAFEDTRPLFAALLAPKDAIWFFNGSETAMPAGWHEIRSDKDAGSATLVIVHR